MIVGTMKVLHICLMDELDGFSSMGTQTGVIKLAMTGTYLGLVGGLFEKQVNAQKEMQAHDKVCDENERDKQTKKKQCTHNQHLLILMNKYGAISGCNDGYFFAAYFSKQLMGWICVAT